MASAKSGESLFMQSRDLICTNSNPLAQWAETKVTIPLHCSYLPGEGNGKQHFLKHS